MTLYKQTILFVLDTPDCCGKSSNGWRLVSSTGISPPAGSLSAALIACDGSRTKKRFNARTVTEQEYHCPYCLSSPYREPPDTDSRLFSLLAENESQRPKNKYRCNLAALFPAYRGAVANVAYCKATRFPGTHSKSLICVMGGVLMLITIAIGMCLMNGYLIVKGHAHSPHKEENRQRVFVSLHLFPHLTLIVQPPIQEFFSIFFRPPLWIFQRPEKYNPPFQRFVRM